MEYIGIGICVIAVLSICMFIIRRKKNNSNASANLKTDAEKQETAVSDDAPTELIIEMEMLPAEVIKDESALVEITDSKVLAHVNNLVPGLA